MSKQYNGGWEGPIHFKEWAAWMGWDVDMDPPPRIWLSFESVNRETAISCLLNQWDRPVQPMAWDLADAFLDIGYTNVYAYEEDAVRFLKDIAYLEIERQTYSFDLGRIGR